MSQLKDRIQQDVKSAMRAQDKAKLAALRLITAAIKQREVDERIELDDEQIIASLSKMAKQRRESISQFEQANRNDLVEKETFELELIQSYLPTALSEQDIEKIIQVAIQQLNASSVKEMGQVMAIIKPQIQGRADIGEVSKKVKDLLSTN